MRAYGTDRVGKAEDGNVTISSRISKGWVARVPATMVRTQRQGTAVLWDDEHFEVVDAEPLPTGGVRYTLEPWREEDVMRVSDAYDEASEARRIEEYRKSLVREKKRKSANWLGIFTGHLPSVVQQEMAFELGVNPQRLTMMSALPLIVICGIPCFLFITALMAGTPPPIPIGVFIVFAYLTAESILRFNFGFMGNSMGSLAGFIGYAIFDTLTGAKATRKRAFDGEKGSSITITEAPADIAMRDALAVREPLITLLPSHDQKRIMERYDYDYRKQSTKMASIILIFAVIGFFSSIQSNARLAAIVAAAIALEQIWRIYSFRRGPAGSVFGFVVRPFVRKLLE